MSEQGTRVEDLAATRDVEEQEPEVDVEDNVDEEQEQEQAPEPDPKDALKADLAKERERRKAAEAELRRLKAESQDTTAETEAVTANTEKWQAVVKNQAARAALATAGVPKEKLARALKVLDMSQVDVTDDGEVDGLDSEIEALRTDFPELFPPAEDAAPERKRAPRVDASGKPAPKKPQTSADKLASALFGGN